MKPPLSIVTHRVSPGTSAWSMWLSYVPNGLGEVIATGQTYAFNLSKEPVRYDLIHDHVGDTEEETD